MALPSSGGAASQIVGSQPPAFKKRVIDRPKTRARVPTSEHPNFRDHGLSVERPLLALLCRLQTRYGYGRMLVAEAGLRKMLGEDTGHMPGVCTVRHALRRLARQGTIVQEALTKGEVLPEGQVVQHGARRIYVPQARRLHKGVYRERERLTPFRFAEARALLEGASAAAAGAKRAGAPAQDPPPPRRHCTAAELEAILRATPRQPPEPPAPS
jgi:hypothetical protein